MGGAARSRRPPIAPRATFLDGGVEKRNGQRRVMNQFFYIKEDSWTISDWISSSVVYRFQPLPTQQQHHHRRSFISTFSSLFNEYR